MKLEREQKVEQRAQWRQYAVIAVLAAVGLFGGLYLLSLGGGSDEVETTTTSITLGTTTTTEPVVELVSAVSAPEPGATILGAADCPEADGSSERVTTFSEPPPTCIGVTVT